MMNTNSTAANRKMRLSVLWILAIAVLLGVLPQLNLVAQEASTTSETKAAIVAAANTFLATLDETQQAAVLFDFSDEAQRENWSNLPTGLFSRNGISYGTMTTEQQEAVMALLQVALSEQGYEKVIAAMTADEILLQSSSGIGAGINVFGFAEYYISFLGTPSETDPWIMQWGGHHFALNITFVGTEEILTPSLTGCQPCVYTVNDEEVSVLGDEYDKAFALLNALDATQQATAVLDYSVTDLVLGAGEEERVLESEGLAGSEMTAEQQAMLLDVISEWVNIATDEAAAIRMAELTANINDTYFAWSGDVTGASVAYFRVTGPTLLIEFAPQGMGGGGGGGGRGGGNAPSGSTSTTSATSTTSGTLDLGTYTVVQESGTIYHVHSIYRDITNPYGSASTGE